MSKVPFVGQTTENLCQLFAQRGLPGFRGKQVAKWLYERAASEWDQLTDLPVALRTSLAEEFALRTLNVTSRDAADDGTIKYLMGLQDGEVIETVYLPYSERVSICLSSQVGCAAGCTFCATAQGGLARSMTAGEIVEQLLVVQSQNPERRISHAVFMGMGEPLFNYDNVIGAIRLMTGEMGMSARNLTISTVGVVPGILALAEESLSVTLALSLHAPDDDLRETLIPTARKWPMAEILEACRTYHAKSKRNLTFEYLLIGDLNDSVEQAHKLARVLEKLPGNVNLIPFNYVDTPQGFKRPTRERIDAFRAALESRGRVTTERMVRGHAISAACGQLRRMSGTLRTSTRTIALTSASS